MTIYKIRYYVKYYIKQKYIYTNVYIYIYIYMEMPTICFHIIKYYNTHTHI